MNQMMFSRTGSAEFPTFLKCMITGPPKSGKTMFLGSVPNILILDTEPHANNLQSIAHLDIPFKAIYSTDELRQAQFILSQDQFRQQAAQALGMPSIDAVGIDTLDTLQTIMKRERMREQRTTKFLRDDWSWIKEEMTSILEGFLSLPMHVFLTVHVKTKDIGSEDNPQTIILPGLEGSIAEQIAGMVGYSLLTFRTQEVRTDGTPYTKYWMRAEGNDTYQYLGNRAAGRLPDVIEPDFKTLYAAAMAGRPQQQTAPVPVELTGVQTTGQIQPQPNVGINQSANQPTAEPQPQQQAQQQPVAQNAGQPQQQPTGQPQNMPADDEPVNAAALGHVKKVYDALGQPFPQDKIAALNLGQARALVKTFKAIQMDASEGKGPEGESATQTMTNWLSNMDLLADEGAPSAQPEAVEPKLDGTIEQVKAYVGDSLERANEAFEAERTGKNRKSLMDWLESKGASHGAAPEQPQPQQPQQQAEVQTPVQSAPAPETPASPPAEPTESSVTPGSKAADEHRTEESATALVQNELGATVIDERINANALCEECGNQIDDVDLAQLGKSRFGRILCVNDYIAETKKPRG